jgi:hypothetical protein
LLGLKKRFMPQSKIRQPGGRALSSILLVLVLLLDLLGDFRERGGCKPPNCPMSPMSPMSPMNIPARNFVWTLGSAVVKQIPD